MSALKPGRVLCLAVVALAAPALTWGAGFALFEHGNRAMGMAGAMTGVADDPSALYWNPAGLAFQHDKGFQVMTGVTFITAGQEFYGDSPYPGEGYFAEQEDQTFFPAHFYMVYPVSERLTLAGGVLTPFGLGTYWADDHAGRFISKRVDLKTFDLTGVFSYKLSDAVAVSAGVDYIVSTIDLTRNLGAINPFTQYLTDVAQVHLFTDGLGNSATAWNASFLLKLGGGFQLGARYRSGFEIDYEGEASFTQYSTGNPELDAIVAGTLPFDNNEKITTYIDFPEVWHVGLSWSNETWTFATAYGEMGWSSFDQLPINFVDRPDLSGSVIENYFDTKQYRIGAEYRASDSFALQLGYLFDETPQPPESMSPLLGDGDRDGYTIGLSFIHGKLRTDIGYMYLPFETRSTGGEALDRYDGTYETTAHLYGASLTLTF